MFKRKTTTLTARTVQIALALSATSTAFAETPLMEDWGYTSQEAVDAIAAANTDYKTKSHTVSPDELEPSSAAAADAAADLQDTLALELGRYGETSLEIILIDEFGKANLFEMFFNVPDHNDKGSFIDFVIDQNFGLEDMAGFTDDVLLGGLGLDRPGESAKGVVIPSEGGGLFGGIEGIPELNTSVEFKRSWDLAGMDTNVVPQQHGISGKQAAWGAAIAAGVIGLAASGQIAKAAGWIGLGLTMASPPSTPTEDEAEKKRKEEEEKKKEKEAKEKKEKEAKEKKEKEAKEKKEKEAKEKKEKEAKEKKEKEEEEKEEKEEEEKEEEATSNPGLGDTGGQIITQEQEDELRESVTYDDSAARALGESLLAIMFRNLSNPVPEERGASSRGTGDLLGDCVGLPPWECNGDSLSVSAVGQSGIVITGLGTQNSQTSGQSMTGRGSGVPTGPGCDEPNQEDCI